MAAHEEKKEVFFTMENNLKMGDTNEGVFVSPKFVERVIGVEGANPVYVGNTGREQTSVAATMTYEKTSGGVIADSVGAAIKNAKFAVLTVADGCSLGVHPANASRFASSELTKRLSPLEGKIEITNKNPKDDRVHDLRARSGDDVKVEVVSDQNVREPIADVMERTFLDINRELAKKYEGVGTTTLLGGILITDEDGNGSFICCSVGDCQAFVYRLSRAVYTLNPQFRDDQQVGSGSDPGGRLGDVGKPDMRNFGVTFFPIERGDLLLLCTDGLHDNLCPEMLGVDPDEALEYVRESFGQFPDVRSWGSYFRDLWSEATWAQFLAENGAAATNRLKNRYREAKLQRLLIPVESDATSSALALVKYAAEVTAPSLRWILENPTERLPKDYQRFPGKMDHICVLVHKVTRA